MTPKEEIEKLVSSTAIARSTNRSVGAFIAMIGFIIFGAVAFAVGSVERQQQHTVLTQRALSASALAERQISGTRAMIVATCAMRAHDLKLEYFKWHSLTLIESVLKITHYDPIDAAYHRARNKILRKARAADLANLNLDCLAVMRKAYQQSTGVLPPLVEDSEPIK